MRRSRSTAAALAAVLAAAAPLAPAGLRAQDAMPMRALELESSGKLREAAAAYRESLGTAQLGAVVFGLERVYDQLGDGAAILPLLDSLIARRPRESLLHTVRVRTLVRLGRDADARQAFERWVSAEPRESTPFKGYARQLIDAGRASAADTVLQMAARVLGSTRDFALEYAQLRAALGLWQPAARSWREVVASSPELEQAAALALAAAPDSSRAAVREILIAPPTDVAARRVLAQLELRWRSAREGWAALRDLPAGDTATVTAWAEFASHAEAMGAPLVARDALAAAADAGRTELLPRAAGAALAGGDARGALALASRSVSEPEVARQLTLVRLRALAALGRAAEAEAVLAEAGPSLDGASRADALRSIAAGWVQAGDLTRARAALDSAGSSDDRTAGWLALYDGDLASARRLLRRAAEQTRESLLAMALLSRTRADSSAALGHAFLALARRDSATAATGLAAAADSLTDAAPLLLSTAARVHSARRDDAAAIALWKRIVERHTDAPEAAEADLEWARTLRRGGKLAEAAARLEHLILTYPQSALVPQARRELEIVRGNVPPSP